MLKIIKANKDAYITNKIVRKTRKVDGNTGAAGTLDLFKIYGTLFSGSYDTKETSRILIHFDLSEIKSLHQNGKLDINDDSFMCKLLLKDVYGGQTTPVNFAINVFPLSSSFAEGIGKDISYYSDSIACNWLSSSSGNLWNEPGCSLPCDATQTAGDYITSSFSLNETKITQNFINGDEDLLVDVTSIVSATISGELPDSGFRISFGEAEESNTNTYFVKRFASRQAYDESKHPQLIFGFDDSITDDSQNLTFDESCKLSLYNYSKSQLSNIRSGSSLLEITGSNCLLLKMMTVTSGGYHELTFSGSQFSLGSTPVQGIYQSSITIPSNDNVIKTKLQSSGSVEFIPVWTSIDKSIAYYTGSIVTVRPSERSSNRSNKNFLIKCGDLSSNYGSNQEVKVLVNIFDQSSPYMSLTKVPIVTPGIVLKNVFYQIRDAVTKEPIIPFDDIKNSTKVSSDSKGMFFNFYTSSLSIGKTYIIDIMIIDGEGTKVKYMNASSIFGIERP